MSIIERDVVSILSAFSDERKSINDRAVLSKKVVDGPITVAVDGFGFITNQLGEHEVVTRYTFSNKNRMSVQVNIIYKFKKIQLN